jgi:hypothetical protein
MDENNSGKILLAFVAGAAVGVAIGYFLNSDKKDELVSDLKEGASNLKRGFDDSLGKAKDFVESFIDKEPENEEEAQSKN